MEREVVIVILFFNVGCELLFSIGLDSGAVDVVFCGDVFFRF